MNVYKDNIVNVDYIRFDFLKLNRNDFKFFCEINQFLTPYFRKYKPTKSRLVRTKKTQCSRNSIYKRECVFMKLYDHAPDNPGDCVFCSLDNKCGCGIKFVRGYCELLNVPVVNAKIPTVENTRWRYFDVNIHYVYFHACILIQKNIRRFIVMNYIKKKENEFKEYEPGSDYFNQLKQNFDELARRRYIKDKKKNEVNDD